jgi:hypothetical protein
LDVARFDRLASAIATELTRRGMFAALGTGALAWLHDARFTGAKKRQTNKKKKKKKRKSKPNLVAPPPPPPPPQAPPLLALAYQCPLGGVIAFEGARRVAQAFTATRGGTLREIHFPIVKPKGSQGDYVVQLIRASGSPPVPSNNALDILAISTVPDSTVAEDSSTLIAKFDGPSLTQGVAYAAVIARLGDAAAEHLQVRVRVDTSVCEGQLANALGADPFVTWAANDLVVSVFVS